MLRANSSLMDTNMALLALEDLPISNAVAEFGSELQFLKSLPGTLCCSCKHAEKTHLSVCVAKEGAAFTKSSHCGQPRNLSVSFTMR